ncbi:MAG: hypothetical protein MUF06_09380 [Pirellulaceae bacterium]|jgi:hypothetical protein|nr:hypothetical protein [Pirellulaceae bacterium]
MSHPYQQTPYQQPPYGNAPFPQDRQKSGSGCGWGLLIGCLGAVVLAIVLCAGIGLYVRNNADKWIAGIVREGIVAVVRESEIPEAEKTEVIAQIDRVVDAYKARRINQQDLEGIFEQLQESPVFVLISVWGIEQAYLAPSGLTAEEKEAGRLVVQRSMRGVVEKKISQESLSAAIPSNGQVGQNGESADGLPPGEDELQKSVPPVGGPERQLTDDEVRQMLARLKQLADDAQIPAEPYIVDIGDAMKQVVDKALAGKE